MRFNFKKYSNNESAILLAGNVSRLGAGKSKNIVFIFLILYVNE